VRQLASWTDIAVGLSLIAIGALGIKEAFDWKLEDRKEEELYAEVDIALVISCIFHKLQNFRQAGGVPRKGANRAIIFNGLLHGFSWDGTPSLAPALALPSVNAVLLFLIAYSAGTVLAMSAVTTIIGEGSLRVGEKLRRPDLPQKLSFVSSGLAMMVGVIWTARALPSLL